MGMASKQDDEDDNPIMGPGSSSHQKIGGQGSGGNLYGMPQQQSNIYG